MTAITNYFTNIPLIQYRFGDAEDPVLFNNITQYVDLIDELKENVAFYNKYTIQSGERPDTLSYRLYGTVDYYWTFFLLNDNLRREGWPISTNEVLNMKQSKYPYRTLVTTTEIADIFTPGDVFRGTTSGTTGTVIKRNLDLGQIVYDSGGNNLNSGETITYLDAEFGQVTASVLADYFQYDSVHHYEDADGITQDIDPHTYTIPSGYVPVTWGERLEAANDSLREISVFNPDVIGSIVSEFFEFHRGQ